MTNEERAHEVAMLAVNYSVGSHSSKHVTELVSEVYLATYKSVMDGFYPNLAGSRPGAIVNVSSEVKSPGFIWSDGTIRGYAE